MRGQVTDLLGQHFSHWKVEAPSDRRSKFQRAYWLCRCACGTVREVEGDRLKQGRSRSCGCRALNRDTPPNLKHGMYYTRAYRTHESMMRRCYCPSNSGYRNYGGRGISVAPEWHDFKQFYADMGDPPDELSLDRIDVDGNYCKANCRWATRSEQARNRRPRERWNSNAAA